MKAESEPVEQIQAAPQEQAEPIKITAEQELREI